MRGIILFLLWIVSFPGHAQTDCVLQLSGVVKDAVTKEPLPLAKVGLLQQDRWQISDMEGRFVFDSLCRGEYTMKVSYVGYDSVLQSLIIDNNTERRIYLSLKVKQLRQTEIVAERIKEKSTIETDTISEKEMQNSRGKDLTSYLKQVSGVTGIQTGPSIMKPVIHGMHSQRVMIMNAGIRQEGQQWGSEHAPEIDPFVANRLTVIKGTSSIRYGADAIGGVILVEPRQLPHEPGIQAELNLVAMSNGRQGVASGLLEQHLGKFFDLCWRLQGTAKKAGNLRTPDLYLQNTAFEEYNWSGSVGLERRRFGAEVFYSRFKTSIGIFTGAHIGNLSDLRRIIESGQTITDNTFTYRIDKPRQEVTHQLLSLKAWWTITAIGKLNLQYGYQYNHRYEFDRDKPFSDSLAALNIPDLELRLYTQSADLNLETYYWKGITAVAGVSSMMQDNQYGGSRFFVPNYVLYNLAAYTVLRWRKNKWETEAGARADYRDQSVYRNVNGSILRNDYRFLNPGVSAGALFRPDSSITWTLNLGNAFRPPFINEWFSNGLHHGTATYETGDSTLDVEKAWSVNGGFRMQRKSLSINAGVYFMFIRDYIYLVPDQNPVLTVSGAFPSFSYRHVDASFKGMDLSIDWDLSSSLNLRSRNSLVFGWNHTGHRYLDLVPAPRFDQLLSYRFKDGKNWKDMSAGVSLLYVSEQWRYEEGSDYLPPPGDYLIPSLEGSVTLIFNHQEIRLGASVSNLLNTAYREYLNRFRYFMDETGRNVTLRLTLPMSFRTAPHDHEH